MIRFISVSCHQHLHLSRQSSSVCPFSNQPHVPFSYSCWRGRRSRSHRALSLLAALGTSSTKRPLSTVAATTLGSVPSAASASPSWIRRLGLLRTTATSGWRRGTGDQVGSAVSLCARACTEGWPLSPLGV